MKRMKRVLSVLVAASAAVTAASLLTMATSEDDPVTFMREIVQEVSESKEPEQSARDWAGYPEPIVAIVEIPGTSIEEPVAQGKEENPNAYLFVDAMGRGGYGTPYLDWECGPHSEFAAIYGHHMSDGSVFAELANYSNRDFAGDHPRVKLWTRDDGQMHGYEVVAADVVDARQEGIRVGFEDAGERYAYLSEKIGGSDVVIGEIGEGDRVLALVTCSYQTDNSRTVVYCKEMKG